MKTNILKKEGKAYIRLPDEFSNFDDVELFKLKDGYYLVTLPLAAQPEKQPEKSMAPGSGFQILGEAEKNVLRKLLAIKFQERTPAYVEKALSAEEKNVLRELEDKNFINVFRGKKYPNGVYNINDRVYGALYGKETVAPKQAAAQPAKKESPVQRPVDTLGQKGYAIGTAKDLSDIIEKHRDEIKSGKIKGLKGFDGRFYIARMDYISRMSPLVMKQLDRERGIDEIAGNLGVEPDAVRTVLHILAEAGDVMEKRRGVYAAI